MENKPLITRVHVKYHLRVSKRKKAEVERVVGSQEEGCAVSQSLWRGIAHAWNHPQFGITVFDLANPVFRQITAVGPARQVLFGLKVLF